MTKLYVIRHGQSEANAAIRDELVGRDYGPLGSPLTLEGRRQIEALAAELHGIAFDLLVASDLNRAQESAELLRPVLNLPIISTSAMRERVAPETTLAGGKRLLAFLRTLTEQHSGKTIAVVCHGAIMRGLLITLGYAISTRELPKGAVANAAYILLETDGTAWRVASTHGVTRASPD